MADTLLYAYHRTFRPQLPESDGKYIDNQLKEIERSISSILEKLKALEARLDAGGL